VQARLILIITMLCLVAFYLQALVVEPMGFSDGGW
jgi:hypothetical protein